MRASKLLLSICTLYFLAQFPSNRLFAQNLLADSAALSEKYYTSWSQKENLYKGRQYIGYPSNIKGSPYFLTNLMTEGRLLYENVWYYNIKLLYDTYGDELITVNEEGIRFVLNKSKIKAFEINGHFFVNVQKEQRGGFKSGFYQKLTTEEKAVAYLKRSTQLREKIDGSGVEKDFQPDFSYYVVSGNHVWNIKKEKQLLSALRDKQNFLLDNKRKNNLSFNKNPQEFITQSVNYYNQLSL